MATPFVSSTDIPCNYIEELNTCVAELGLTLEWGNFSTSGPPHDLMFFIEAIVDNETSAEGHGKNKKDAKSSTAKILLEKLKHKKYPNENDACDNVSRTPSPAGGLNYISMLNEYSQKRNISIKQIFRNLPTGMDHKPKFGCTYSVNDKKYPECFGKNKHEAKREAAKQVYEAIFEIQSPTQDKNLVNASPDLKRKPELLNSPEGAANLVSGPAASSTDHGRQEDRNEESAAAMSMDQKTVPEITNEFKSVSCGKSQGITSINQNCIGELNEYCQKLSYSYDIIEIGKSGPPHDRVFICKVVVNGSDYPEASGKNKQEAKRKAAKLALETLKQQQMPVSTNSTLGQFSTSSNSTCSSWITSECSISATKPKPKAKSISLAAKFSLLGIDSNTSQADNEDSRNEFASPREQSSDVSRFNELFSDDTDELGRGGFGIVYKAKKKLENRYYAVKKVFLKNGGKETREVESLACLSHENIVRYYHSWIELSSKNNGNVLYIQMELCEGGNLHCWLEEGENSKPEKEIVAMSIFSQLVAGVKYIHDQNMIHRDLKPANILFSEGTQVKIGDFGLVAVMNNKNDLTANVGTTNYASPEQSHTSSYGYKTDIFSLGLIYFELFWVFCGTAQEKSKEWLNIRRGSFPSPFPEKFNLKTELIGLMLDINEEKRPTAAKIETKLQCDLHKESKTI